MTKAIRVTQIDDDQQYSDIVAAALRQEPDIELVSRFRTSEAAAHQLQRTDAATLPDLILLDLCQRGTRAMDAVSLLRDRAPLAKILNLTQSVQEQDIFQAIALGAAGYLLKTTTVSQLTTGIRTVISGGAALDPGVAQMILVSLRTGRPSKPHRALLSHREVEILSLLADGLVKKEIAARLKIRYTTVDTHVGRIYTKLCVANAPAAVNKAHRLHILPRRIPAE